MERGGRRPSQGMLPLLALHALSEYYRLDRKPPVTAGLVAANTLIYLRPQFLDSIIPPIDDVWFNPYLILKHRDLKRFFLSAFYHVSEPHLVYNMMSLLWKGVQLETEMGSLEFASMVAELLAMSQGISLLLSKSLLTLFDYTTAYYSEYSAGFSGVLFAMKVVLNSRSGDYAFVHGLPVPARHAAWAELFLIQMFVPRVSFLGHLGGILAGILYLRMKGRRSGSGPLAAVIRGLTGTLLWPLRLVRGVFGFRRRVFGRGTVGRGGRGGGEPDAWRCQSCTFDNSGWLSVCEMCGTSRGGHAASPFQSGRFGELSLEELRRHRLERFGR